jgi:hypothetical protein
MTEEICRIKIEENILNVATGKPLTMPLRVLNENCEFRKVWDKFAGKDEEFKAKKREYSQRPEAKAKKREYFQRPEVKARQREYYQRPEAKAKKREYSQRPEVKAKRRERQREYTRRKLNIPRSRWRKI